MYKTQTMLFCGVFILPVLIQQKQFSNVYAFICNITMCQSCTCNSCRK